MMEINAFKGENQLRQKCEHILTYAIMIYCIFSIPSVSGHSPLISGDTGKLDEAMFIPDPTKSWAIYGELQEGREAHYYRFEIKSGQRIYISLMKPTSPEYKGFMPGFVVMGPGLNNRGNIPDYVEKPALANAVVVPGVQPAEATYEPFAPSSFYQLADLNIHAPESGTYYIAVFEPLQGGHYSLAIGQSEKFSLTEWILIPVSLISIYKWEGQSMIMILLTVILIPALGLIFLWKRNWIAKTPFEWTGIMAGFLFIGTGFSVIFQMALALSRTSLVQEVAITVILAFFPVLLGIGVIHIIMEKRERINVRKRAYLAMLGIFALFVWAGFLVGPVLAVLASVMPAQEKKSD
jgi:hypothetical protein